LGEFIRTQNERLQTAEEQVIQRAARQVAQARENDMLERVRGYANELTLPTMGAEMREITMGGERHRIAAPAQGINWHEYRAEEGRPATLRATYDPREHNPWAMEENTYIHHRNEGVYRNGENAFITRGRDGPENRPVGTDHVGDFRVEGNLHVSGKLTVGGKIICKDIDAEESSEIPDDYNELIAENKELEAENIVLRNKIKELSCGRSGL
jgi:hypothetical protein